MFRPFADDAIKDDAIWESIRHHREIYTSVNGMDYTPDVRDRLVLVPREDIMDAWKTAPRCLLSWCNPVGIVHGEVDGAVWSVAAQFAMMKRFSSSRTHWRLWSTS